MVLSILLVTKRLKLINRYVLSHLVMYYLTIKYFENGGKNMSFIKEDDRALDKYIEIW